MVYNIFTYRRPVTTKPSTSSSSISSSSSQRNHASYGIPPALSFDKIISGETCPPLSCRDFMAYLHAVEHCAENLQFLLWYNDYISRFQELPTIDSVLAPEWKQQSSDEYVALSNVPVLRGPLGPKPDKAVQQFFSTVFSSDRKVNPNIDLTPTSVESKNPFDIPTPNIAPFLSSKASSMIATDYKQVAENTFSRAGIKWQPCSAQPFLEEIARVISIYIAEGSPREINISARDRLAVLQALAVTTHPTALLPAKDAVEEALKVQSHPNFVAFSIYNGNRSRVLLACSLGIGTIVAGFFTATLLTLSHYHRGWRALAAIPWFIGTATFVSGLRGMCVILHGLHKRQLHPWELWSDDEELQEPKGSFDSSLTITSKSFETEPWRVRYENRSLLRKIFDKETWIEEPALRQIQDTIAIQSAFIAIFVSATLSTIFILLPAGNYL